MNRVKNSSRRRRVAPVVATALGAASVFAAEAEPAWATDTGWAQAHCTMDYSYVNYTSTYARSRYTAVYPAVYASGEGYHYGGGCWIDDNHDDTPNESPLSSEATHGESTDCSGLVYRAWFLGPNNANETGFYQYATNDYAHGPFPTGSYRSGTTGWKTVSKSSTMFWDVFVSSSHMGLIYQINGDGSDLIFESKGEAAGTGLFYRTYRSDNGYTAAGRNGWAP